MATLKGQESVLLLIVNTLFWGVPLYLLTLLKLVTPTRRWRLRVLAGLNAIALAWIATNNWWIRHWIKPRISAQLPDGLSPRQWWLVIANHQSWTDIFVMQYLLHGRTPMPKFFLKRELIFIPVIGLAWWALAWVSWKGPTTSPQAQTLGSTDCSPPSTSRVPLSRVPTPSSSSPSPSTLACRPTATSN